MTFREPITVTEGMSIGDAVRIMTDRGIRRLPVVDDEDQLVCLVSRCWCRSRRLPPGLRQM